MILGIPMLTVCLVVITYAFGALYAFACNLNRRYMIKAVGWTGFCVFGFIGVPFHELSHLITAFLFNHRVTDFSLYRPIQGRKDGCLGYVNHGYSRSSLYQTVGNFFIGAAPMLFGAGLITVLFHFAVPCDMPVVSEIQSWSDVCHVLSQTMDCLKIGLSEIKFSWWLIALIVSSFIVCPHLGMSGADFKGVVSGTIFLLLASLTVPAVIMQNFNVSYADMCVVFLVFVVYYTYALLIGFVISMLVVLLNKLLSLCTRRKGE